MDTLRDAIALGLVGAGLVSGVAVASLVRAPQEGLRWMLDFVLAAGLLRLSTATTWTALTTVAALVAVRQIAGLGIRRRRAARAPDAATRRPAA